MRVAINAQKTLERETGVGNYAYNLIQGLSHLPGAAQSLKLYLLHGRRALQETCDSLPINSREWGLKGSHWRILWEQLGLPWQVGREGADLVHYLDHALPLLYQPCPAIITVHDLAFYRLPEMYNFGRRAYKQFIGLRSVRRAAHIIAVSESTKKEIIALAGVPESRITVIPYGINPAFRPLPSSDLIEIKKKYDLTRPFFLFVGTLQPRKNIRAIIAALSKLILENNLDCELVLAGAEGWLSGDLLSFAGEKRIADRLRLLGAVPHDRLPELYNSAVALVYPSWYEGFGLPPLEAMACGVSVIASRLTSLPEVVGDAGLLVDPGDIDTLAREMLNVVQDAELRRKLSQLGLDRAKRFSWETCARETYRVYEQVIQERRHLKTLAS